MYKIENIQNTIICGDALTVLKEFPDECIDMVITSPPYWGLRDYGLEPTIWDGNSNCQHEWISERTSRPNQSGGKGYMQDGNIGSHVVEYDNRATYSNFCSKCDAWKGSLGLEPTFNLYIKHLCDIFDEIKRVLKKTGSIWINLGDTYNSKPIGRQVDPLRSKGQYEHKKPFLENMQEKTLCNVPFRFAIEMTNRGWIQRNTIIWYKPNCMPSSAKDRFTVDFEYIFFFVKNKRYWFEQQFKEVQQCSIDRLDRAVSNKHKWIQGADGQTQHTMNKPRPNRNTKILAENHETFGSPRARYHREYKGAGSRDRENNCAISTHHFHESDYLVAPFHPKQGRNERCVWEITTQPYREAHFAVFPEELCITPVKAGCPEFICEKCGKARMKIYESNVDLSDFDFNERQKDIEANIKSDGEKFKRDYLNDPEYRKRLENKRTEVKYDQCNCNIGFKPGIVLDPFAGSGTACLVARKLGRNYIGIELNPEYVKMAEKRIHNQAGLL